MKRVSILLVDNPNASIAKIDLALKEAGFNYTLYFAGSGKNGLDILMGDPYTELIAPDAVKIKPSLVILSKELMDITAFDFLGIIGSYYSLRDTKVFLLSDSLTDAERLTYEKFGVSAYLQRPIDSDQLLREVKPLIEGERGLNHFAFTPVALRAKLAKAGLSTLVKSKIISLGIGTKIAACFVSALMVGTVAIYTANNNRINENLAAGTAEISNRSIEQVMPAEPLPLPESEPEADSKNESIPQKQIVSLQHEITSVSTDSLERSFQKTESSAPVAMPVDLRIKAVAESDSIPN